MSYVVYGLQYYFYSQLKHYLVDKKMSLSYLLSIFKITIKTEGLDTLPEKKK